MVDGQTYLNSNSDFQTEHQTQIITEIAQALCMNTADWVLGKRNKVWATEKGCKFSELNAGELFTYKSELQRERMANLPDIHAFWKKPETQVFIYLPIFKCWQPFQKIYNCGQAKIMWAKQNISEGKKIWAVDARFWPVL